MSCRVILIKIKTIKMIVIKFSKFLFIEKYLMKSLYIAKIKIMSEIDRYKNDTFLNENKKISKPIK